MRETGAVLKTLRISDCADGPHEIRGCIRNELVKALADALPTDTIQYGCSVEAVDTSDEGASACSGLAGAC